MVSTNCPCSAVTIQQHLELYNQNYEVYLSVIVDSVCMFIFAYVYISISFCQLTKNSVNIPLASSVL